MAKALHTDDSITTCDCCGRSGLKFTVCMLLDSGEIAHYGQVCAARNTSKTIGQINKEIADTAAEKIAAAIAELKRTPEWLAETARFASRPRSLVGKAAAEYVRPQCEAANAMRGLIAKKYGIERWALP